MVITKIQFNLLLCFRIAIVSVVSVQDGLFQWRVVRNISWIKLSLLLDTPELTVDSLLVGRRCDGGEDAGRDGRQVQPVGSGVGVERVVPNARAGRPCTGTRARGARAT